MDYFRNHLYLNGKVPSSQIPHYVRWVSRCYDFCGKPEGSPLGDHQVDAFIAQIDASEKENQKKQAADAISKYRFLYHQIQSDADGRTASFEDQWEALLARLQQVVRLQNLPDTVVKVYVRLVRSFLEFWKGVRPTDLSDVHAMLYLRHLSGERDLPKAMCIQTAEALSVFFRYVIQRDSSCFENWTPRADRTTNGRRIS